MNGRKEMYMDKVISIEEASHGKCKHTQGSFVIHYSSAQHIIRMYLFGGADYESHWLIFFLSVHFNLVLLKPEYVRNELGEVDLEL